MKLTVLTLALAASAFTMFGASAQVVIEERHDPPAVIEKERPSVTVEERDRLVVPEKKVIEKETVGSGDCESKTVHKEGPIGSKTVTKTDCD